MVSNGEPAAKAAALSLATFPGAAAAVPGGRVDFLSSLPDHLLVDILDRLRTKEAVATTVLSRRWRGVWAQLPRLYFDGVDPSVPARALETYQALAAPEAHAAADIQMLAVSPNQVHSQQTFAWLSLAAPLLSGSLYLDDSRFVSSDTMDEFFRERRGPPPNEDVSEMPCLQRATEIRLSLGFLAIALPPVGVFDALRLMWLHNFQSRSEFIISDTMLPSLQQLNMSRVRYLNVLTLNSRSLVSVHLSYLIGLDYLGIMAPMLQQLDALRCFYDALKPAARISAEGLQVLRWDCPYDVESVYLGEMPCLRTLGAPTIHTHPWQGLQMAQICARFLSHFAAVDRLELDMILGPEMHGSLLLIEDIVVPDVDVLVLSLRTNGHAFERGVLRLLKRCLGIRELNLSFQIRDEVENCCLPNCICHSETGVEFQMMALTEVHIVNFYGDAPEVYVVEQLLLRAPSLRMLIIASEAEDPSLGDIENLCPAGCKFELVRYRSEKE